MPLGALLRLGIAGGVLVATCAALAVLDAPHRHIPRFLVLYAVAFLAYALAARTVWNARATGRAVWFTIAAVAIAARAVMIPSTPDLSTDIHRYVWEGRVVLSGGNPFAIAPADTALAALRGPGFELINHRHMATIYPPFAQGVFALAAWIHPGVTTLKLLFVLFDLATIAVVAGMLRARGLPATRAIVYAWSPLVMIETAHSGHLDAMGVFFFVLGVALMAQGRAWRAGLALGASFLVKYAALALAPFLLRRRRMATGLALLAVAVAGYAPFLDAGAELMRSLRAYGTTWWFNGPPYLALAGFVDDPLVVRRVLAALGVGFAVVLAHRERDVVRYAYLVTACGLLLAPTVYPWYVIWIIPFLCVFANRAWLLFTGLVAASNWVWVVHAHSGAWMVPNAVLGIEYAPFYLLLAWDALRPRSRRTEPHAA